MTMSRWRAGSASTRRSCIAALRLWVLSGLAAGDDVRDLMAAAAPSYVPGTHGKHLLRAAPDLAEAGGEDSPEVAQSRAEISRLRAHTA